MPDWVEALNAVSADVPRLVGAVLWQSTLLAAAVGLIALALRRAAPAVRYWLWQAVALKLLLMPFWTVAVPLPAGPIPDERPPAAPSETVIEPRPARTDPARPSADDAPPSVAAPAARRAGLSWPAVLVLTWLLGSAVQVAGLAWQRRRLARLLRRTEPADAAVVKTVGELSAELGVRRPPRAVLLDGAGSPFVCGVGRPVLVLPRMTLAALGPGERRLVLLHELAHVRRRDLLWGWLPELARLVWWFHPVAWWVGVQVRLERELACDQLALAHGGVGAADYADTLVRVVSQAARGEVPA